MMKTSKCKSKPKPNQQDTLPDKSKNLGRGKESKADDDKRSWELIGATLHNIGVSNGLIDVTGLGGAEIPKTKVDVLRMESFLLILELIRTDKEGERIIGKCNGSEGERNLELALETERNCDEFKDRKITAADVRELLSNWLVLQPPWPEYKPPKPEEVNEQPEIDHIIRFDEETGKYLVKYKPVYLTTGVPPHLHQEFYEKMAKGGVRTTFADGAYFMAPVDLN